MGKVKIISMQPSQNRNIIVSFLTILLTGIVVLCLVGVVGISALLIDQPSRPDSETSTPFPLDALPGAIDADNGTNLPPEIREKMNQIQVQVIQERGLVPKSTLFRDLLSPEQLREKVTGEIFAGYTAEDAAREVTALHSLNLVDEGFDLQTFYEDMYSEQIAGYYDNETRSMYVIQNQEFGALEKLTYAHEYTHALQDQNFDIKDGLDYNDESCLGRADACSAIQALLEGDATLSEEKWQETAYSPQDHRDLMGLTLGYQSPVFGSAPGYFQKSLLFPYIYGYEFVHHLYEKGGWDAVNAAYRDLPVSTEQILHPAKYPVDQPIELKIPDLSAVDLGGMKLQEEGRMGEWELFLLLSAGINPEARLDVATAAQSAAGWGGDDYAIYVNPSGTGSIFTQCIQWDNLAEADEFYHNFLQYAAGRWADSGSQEQTTTSIWSTTNEYAGIRQTDIRTCWVVSPTREIRDEILAIFER